MNTPKEPPRDYNVEFSPAMQQIMLNALLGDPDAFARARSILNDSYFHDTIRKAVRFSLDYADEYHSLPAVELVKARTGVTVEKYSEDAAPWLLKHVEEFCRHKALEAAILEGMVLLEKGEGAAIQQRVKDAMSISLNSDLGTSYFEDPQSRLQRLRDRGSFVSTGWNALDQKLYGGFTRGALNIFAGGSGSGKSLFLQNIALNWAYAGLNVVYFTLELAEDFVGLRLDSMVTGKSTKDVFREFEDVATEIEEKGKKTGRLDLKKYPEGGTNANVLRAYLKEYEIKFGFKADAILIDYLDLMYPNNDRVDISDQFIKDKFTSEELRALAHEFDVLCVTASQLNRSSIDVGGEFNHSHIAGGISKINTADNVFGIFMSLSYKEKGIYPVILLKTRGSSGVGSKIELGYDPSCMRIYDLSEKPVDITKPMSREEMKRDLKSDGPAKLPSLLTEEAGQSKSSPGVMDLISRMKKQAKADA